MPRSVFLRHTKILTFITGAELILKYDAVGAKEFDFGLVGQESCSVSSPSVSAGAVFGIDDEIAPCQ
jgi:hypothetical protein